MNKTIKALFILAGLCVANAAASQLTKDYGNGTIATGEFYGGYLINGKIEYDTNKTGGDAYTEYVFGKFERDGKLHGTIKTSSGKEMVGTFIVVQEGGYLLDGENCKSISIDFVEEGAFSKGSLIKGKISWESGALEEGDFLPIDKFTTSILNGNNCVKKYAEDGPKEQGEFNEGYLQNGTITHLDGHVTNIVNCRGLIESAEGREEGSFMWDPEAEKYVLDGEQCQRTLKDGTIEQGKFVKDKLHGGGSRLFKNGQVEQGSFDRGILMGS